MKDNRTHLAYKTEHVVDLESDLLLAATVPPANRGDPASGMESLADADANLDALVITPFRAILPPLALAPGPSF